MEQTTAAPTILHRNVHVKDASCLPGNTMSSHRITRALGALTVLKPHQQAGAWNMRVRVYVCVCVRVRTCARVRARARMLASIRTHARSMRVRMRVGTRHRQTPVLAETPRSGRDATRPWARRVLAETRGSDSVRARQRIGDNAYVRTCATQAVLYYITPLLVGGRIGRVGITLRYVILR